MKYIGLILSFILFACSMDICRADSSLPQVSLKTLLNSEISQVDLIDKETRGELNYIDYSKGGYKNSENKNNSRQRKTTVKQYDSDWVIERVYSSSPKTQPLSVSANKNRNTVNFNNNLSKLNQKVNNHSYRTVKKIKDEFDIKRLKKDLYYLKGRPD